MLLVLGTVAALAGGGGVLVELGPGGSWTNATGPIVRGASLGGSVGAFWGPYQSTLQYGRYKRAGLRANAFAASPFLGAFESGVASIGPEIGAGIDLLKVGAYWRGSVEIAGFLPDLTTETVKSGVVVRVAGGAVWWPTRNMGLLLRAELATNQPFVEEINGSFSAGLGFGFMFRAGGVRSRDPDWAESDLSLDAIPMEEPAGTE